MSDETIRLVALNPADYKSTTVSLPKPPRDRSRFAVLLLLVFIPFGGHFFKAAQSAMQPYFMASGLMDATRYGIMCLRHARADERLLPPPPAAEGGAADSWMG